MKTQNRNTTKTVLVISVGLGIIFLLFKHNWALYTSLVIGVLGIISDKLSAFIDAAWMKLAKVLSFIMPNIILSIVFYLLLSPLALLVKLFANKNLLHLKNDGTSLWINNNNAKKKISFKKPW